MFRPPGNPLRGFVTAVSSSNRSKGSSPLNLISSWHRQGLAVMVLSLLASSGLAADLDLTAPPGKAVVVVYRPAKVPGVLLQRGGASRVAFDDQWLSSLQKGEHFIFHAWPGKHRFESAIGFERQGTIEFELKAGEIYYVAAGPTRPTPVSLVSSTGTDVKLVTREFAESDLAGSKPVPWAREMVEGTFGEVRVLDRIPGNATEFGPVEWHPDVDSIKTSTFKRSSMLKGAVLVTEDALLIRLTTSAGGAEPMGVRIPYADIASVEVKNKMAQRAVVVTRRNGRLDSFAVTTAGGGRIDRERTQAAGELLAGRLPR
jgi:hypothetical protein